MAVVENQCITDRGAIYHGDAAEVLKGLPSDSVHYAIFSPAFVSLYTYSNSERDLGNCRSYEEFFEHYNFMAEEMYRVLKPGRLLSFHCMLLPTTIQHHGYIGLEDFRGDLIRAHKKTGLIHHSEVCIWKDPVTAMQRTKAIGLLHKQVVKDSCMSRQGIPDYLVTMRKPGVNTEPVAGQFDQYIGAEGTGPRTIGGPCPYCNGTGEIISTEPDDYGEIYKCHACDPKKDSTRFSIEVWQRYASPVWMDINPSDTLQRESAREDADERHICPLQLQVIERAIELWTNPGDIVLSPFAGIGSEGYIAVKMGRKAVLIELKESYYKQACANIRIAEREATQGTLYESLEASQEGSDPIVENPA